jgi:hypothetical protein
MLPIDQDCRKPTMTHDQSDDRVQILHTMAVYCTSVDNADLDGVVSVFMPDGRLELSSGVSARGREAIRAFYAPVLGLVQADGARPLLRHNLSTSRVEFIDPVTAQSHTYFLSVTSFGLDTSGSYFDTFKRLGTRWLIDVRRIEVEWYASPSWYESVRLKAKPKSGG